MHSYVVLYVVCRVPLPRRPSALSFGFGYSADLLRISSLSL